MTDKNIIYREKRLKNQLHKIMLYDDKIIEMYAEQSLLLMDFLTNSGNELHSAEQELIVIAIIAYQQLSERGAALQELIDLIPQDETVDEVFDKLASGKIWKNPIKQPYIDRDKLWDVLTAFISTHDENYAWIVDNHEAITSCIQRINILHPDRETKVLQTEIPIHSIDENRRSMRFDCLDIISIDFKLMNINKKLESLIGELLDTEEQFIKSCKNELIILQSLKENHNLNKNVDEALKHYHKLENIWSRSLPDKRSQAQVDNHFIEDNVHVRNKELHDIFVKMNHLSGSNYYKDYFESLRWLMVYQAAILDNVSNAVNGLDKLNASFPEIKLHASEIYMRIPRISQIFELCQRELTTFLLSLDSSEWNSDVLENALKTRATIAEITHSLDNITLSVSKRGKQLELLTDFSAGLRQCKEIYKAQAGRFFSWVSNYNSLFQFINDLNILIECNGEEKTNMLVNYVKENMTTYAGYTDLILIFNRFLDAASPNQSHPVKDNSSQIFSANFG